MIRETATPPMVCNGISRISDCRKTCSRMSNVSAAKGLAGEIGVVSVKMCIPLREAICTPDGHNLAAYVRTC